MDRSMEEAENSLKGLEEEITCSICQEHYTQPKILPCLHYYCKHCILKLTLRKGKDQPFSCPECRKEATLPEGKEDNLQTAFFVNRFKELYDKQKRALSKEKVKCEMCTTSQVKAEVFCRQCDKFMCEKCMEAHERLNVVFDGHVVLSLHEVKKERAKDILPKDHPAKKCQVQTKSMFCFDCGVLICCDCTLKDHRDHNFDFTNLAAENKRKELMESLRPLRKVVANLSCAVEEIQTTESELAAQGESVANTIGKSFEELHAVIERHKQKMLEEAKKRVCEKLEKLEEQKKDISISLAEMQSIVDYTEQCVKHCSNDEVMCVHAEIENRIQRKIIDSNKPGQKLVPMEEVDVAVEVRCAEDLEQLLQTQAKITSIPVSLVIKTVSSKAEVGKLSEVMLCTTQLCGNKPAKHAVQIDCHMKCLHSGAHIKSCSEEVGTDKYCIQFTPSLRGRHELTISVDGHQVAGSPFPLFVLIAPIQLGQCVNVWDGVTGPLGITVNSLGEIIVTECAGDVMVLDKVGKRLRSINDSEHQFQEIQGIAVDSEDNIYFIDLFSNRIFKSNKNCSKVQVHRVQQVEDRGHYDVAVVGDEVMVTELGNEGRIMVYDRELKYVRQIVGADKRTLCCLSPDSHQNVYVSGRWISTIQVFSNDGAFLRSFGCDENGVKMLKYPCGVCVAGQYVYVADSGVRKIVVFTTEGDYVTSFCGGYYDDVCVNQDGFVYATDCSSDKIDIF